MKRASCYDVNERAARKIYSKKEIWGKKNTSTWQMTTRQVHLVRGLVFIDVNIFA